MAFIFQAFCYYVSFFNIFNDLCSIYTSQNLSEYPYPKPESSNDNTFTIAIMGTNDLHGVGFPQNLTDTSTGSLYSSGGIDYLAGYIKALRKQWGNRFIWLDAGDKYQGTIESRLSNWNILNDFFNEMGLNATVVGNHDFDQGQETLFRLMGNAKFMTLSANAVDKQTKELFHSAIKASIMLNFDEENIKIGVIGLSTKDTITTTSGNISNIEFLDYKPVVEREAKKLREQGANAVVLVAHLGTTCNGDLDTLTKLSIKSKENTAKVDCDDNSDLVVLLNSLEKGTINAVVGGHRHQLVNKFYGNVPVIQTISGGSYFNLIYLKFNRTTKALIDDSTLIEGPIPICNRLFSSNNRCDFLLNQNQSLTSTSNNKLKRFYFHNEMIVNDQQTYNKILLPYLNETMKYKEKLTSTEVFIQRLYDREYEFGNLVCDCVKNFTKTDVVFLNNGGFRSKWYPGDILVDNIYNMFPFDNRLVSVEMTGEELLKTIKVVQEGKKSLYSTSGLAQAVTFYKESLEDSVIKSKKLTSASMFNGDEIVKDKVYTIGTIDFLIPIGGDDFANVLSWYKPVNKKDLGDFREMFINCLRGLPVIKEGSFMDKDRKRVSVDIQLLNKN